MTQRKSIDKGTLIIILILITLILFLINLSNSRKKELNSDYTLTKAHITEVLINTSKSTLTKRNIAKYFYSLNGKTYNTFVEIYNKEVKANSCYEIKVSNKNPNNNKINLDKKISCIE